MLVEDLEIIVNGLHLMTEDELEEFIKTRSLPRRIAARVGGEFYPIKSDLRSAELMKQRKIKPAVRKAQNLKARALVKSGMAKDPDSPEIERARVDWGRPEKLRRLKRQMRK